MTGTDLKDQARQVREVLDAKRAEASTAWAALEALKASAIKEEVNFASDAAAFDKFDSAGKSYDTLRDEVAALEYRYNALLGRAGGPGEPAGGTKGGDGAGVAETAGKTWGARYVESDVYAALKSRLEIAGSSPLGSTDPVRVCDRSEIIRVLRNAVLTGTVGTGAAGEGGSALFEQRIPGIVGIPQVPLTVLDLITIGETDERMVSWVVESLFENNAAETAENALKPESNFGFLDKDTTVRDIAHWTKVTRQMLRDVAALRSWLDERMGYGVRRRAQRQVLQGDGIGVNLLGLYNQPGILSQSKGADPMVETIHKGVTKIRTTYFDEPTAVGMHPNDWEAIALAKTVDGVYYYGGPAGTGPKTVWGFPVAVSVDFPAGFPMVADFKEAVLWVREGLTVSSTDSNEDDFKYNRVTLRAEMAAAFGVLQPAAILEVVA